MAAMHLLCFTRLMEEGKCGDALVILQGHPEIVRVLHRPSATVLQTCVTPAALQSKDAGSVLQELLRVKCDPNEVGTVAKDPVLYMCAGENTSVKNAQVLCDILLEAKADPNLCSSESVPIGCMSPLMQATLSIRPTIVKRLLKAGADPTYTLSGMKALEFLFIRLQQDNTIRATVENPIFSSLSPQLQDLTRALVAAAPSLPPPDLLLKRSNQIIRTFLKTGVPFPAKPVMHGKETPLQILETLQQGFGTTMKNKICVVCHKLAGHWCGRCKKVRYCSLECQKEHWVHRGHREQCVPAMEGEGEKKKRKEGHDVTTERVVGERERREKNN